MQEEEPKSRIVTPQIKSLVATTMSKQLNAKFSCICGKVTGRIHTPSALRIVCHCSDCRGYYQALDKRGGNRLAPLTPWGGVDLLQINPNELTFDDEEVKEHLALAKIKENYSGKASSMPRIYAKCCDTPLYTHGMSILFNANLLSEEDRKPIPVKFNIMGRFALKPTDDIIGKEKRPKISSSIPFTWPFVMMGRAGKASKNKKPSPWIFPDISEAEVINVASFLAGNETKGEKMSTGQCRKKQTAPDIISIGGAQSHA